MKLLKLYEEFNLEQSHNLHMKYDKNYDGRFESKTEEKYYLWTDKSGRGEKSVELTKTHIEDTWDLDEEDYNDVTLGDYLEDSYIGDVWETITEKLECIKIY